jgi:predicted Zn-dependent peptidase
MVREINDYTTGAKPATQAEVDKARADEINGLPGSFETASAVMNEIGDIVRYDRPDNYVVKHAAQVEALTTDDVNAAAKDLDPKAMTWVVVGDLSKIEQPIRDLKLGTVTVIDADGHPVAK